MTADAFATAAAVTDPELPVVTIAELGILRDAHGDGTTATVTITPTYSGCPAMGTIRADIARALRAAGYTEVDIRTEYAPAWTTDWITPAGRRKLAAAGIAPPGAAPGGRTGLPLVGAPPPECPRCGSTEVAELSRFGPTACTSLWRCHTCLEPFEHVKPH
ncbi:ring-1,2-phenylacetyl-CoA epoxidase subunit PaaD [Stackebrandtia albiflava]|uniref:Ring-1,2-phenylacetyl-CoA epoxidase subunit PaaD n=1 Tax=Stackebrandtia albiflava TaxID=406432 RepID=A0A562UXU7_9ACTN|nr:1,2-phenylacetyl-CoA epoxidase subunit PaaD [Stackebrandtia albiflava]TWJ10470.1 ring-1,2-phenylacetyl-CoA epoxidase subunit PaaD [Stackebrandtia albiflava]